MILRAEFANAIEFINKDLPEDNHLRFLHWDINKQPRMYVVAASPFRFSFLVVLLTFFKSIVLINGFDDNLASLLQQSYNGLDTSR